MSKKTTETELKAIFKIAKEKKEQVVVILDTETTGVDIEDRIIQNAHAIYTIGANMKLTFHKYLEEYIEAPLPIKPGAAAVHGIWKQDLVGAKVWKKSNSYYELDFLSKKGAYFVAHNSPFDLGMLEKEGIVWPEDKVIDTLRIARHIFSEDELITSKSLQWLRYYFDYDSRSDFSELVSHYGIKRLQAHTALSDIVVLVYFLKDIIKSNYGGIELNSLQVLVDFTMKPLFEDKVTFGNEFERGTKLSVALSSTYMKWGKPKTGLSYYNWAMKNMENLSIDQKCSISYICMNLVKEGKLKIGDPDLKPMIFIAASFIPETWEMLTTLGYNVESMRDLVNKSLTKKVSDLNESGDGKDQIKAISMLNEQLFMERYVNREILKIK